jgi:phospho-N-acetylmuramoyl-pentapeptide-transferase
MLLKLSSILIFALVAFFLAVALYPSYIRLLRKYKVGKQIRETAVTGEKSAIFTELHIHKTGTPNLWGGLFLLIMLLMIGAWELLQHWWIITNSLVNRQETYILLFGFFSMGLLGLVDDYLNVKGKGTIKGLSARGKMIGMVLFAAFISWWFYARLDVDFINLWPIAGIIEIGVWYPILTFLLTISIVNAINITDGLDGLAGGLITIVLMILAVATFFYQTYIATTVIAIVITSLLGFLWYNINPARIFMGDSGAFALGGLVASLLYILNMRGGILIPFIVLFAIFIIEIASSGLQIFWKKVFKRKLLPVAPIHHMYEKAGHKETSIVMKAWLIQGVLAAITIIALFFQFHSILPS